MSLNAILQAIREAGEAQVRDIRNAADQQVDEIRAAGEREAAQARRSAHLEGMAGADEERAKILNRARFEALCIVGEARETLTGEVLAHVRQQLSQARSSPGYPDLLRGLFYEALRGLQAQGVESRFEVEADPRDRRWLEALVRECGLDLLVCYSLSTWGGVNARDADGRYAVLNTLESRLEKARPYLLEQLARELSLCPEKDASPQWAGVGERQEPARRAPGSEW